MVAGRDVPGDDTLLSLRLESRNVESSFLVPSFVLQTGLEAVYLFSFQPMKTQLILGWLP